MANRNMLPAQRPKTAVGSTRSNEEEVILEEDSSSTEEFLKGYLLKKVVFRDQKVDLFVSVRVKIYLKI